MDDGARGPFEPRTADSSRPAGPGQEFEVRITGRVPDDVLSQLSHVEIVAREVRTSIRGHFRDQAELHGFLAKLRTLRLDVVEIRRIASPADSDDAGTGLP
jgi:hypothetical protein